jgi:hypothetical protein
VDVVTNPDGELNNNNNARVEMQGDLGRFYGTLWEDGGRQDLADRCQPMKAAHGVAYCSQ